MPGRTSAGVGKHRIPPSTRGMRDERGWVGGWGCLWVDPWLPAKGSFPALRAKGTQPFPSLIYAESLSARPATGSQERSTEHRGWEPVRRMQTGESESSCRRGCHWLAVSASSCLPSGGPFDLGPPAAQFFRPLLSSLFVYMGQVPKGPGPGLAPAGLCAQARGGATGTARPDAQPAPGSVPWVAPLVSAGRPKFGHRARGPGNLSRNFWVRPGSRLPEPARRIARFFPGPWGCGRAACSHPPTVSPVSGRQSPRCCAPGSFPFV